jgi:hypothetical protein
MNNEDFYYYELMRCLRFLKSLHDFGIYYKTVGNIQKISEDDYYELVLRGLEHAAPIFGVEELGQDVCCGGHVVYHFSSPDILEYYRLCRLLEYQRGIEPKDNPYIVRADESFTNSCRNACSDFGACFNDDTHVREIQLEVCPECMVYEEELIEVVCEMLEFYHSELEKLRAEFLGKPLVWLPALPAHKQTKKIKPRKKAEKALKKVS